MIYIDNLNMPWRGRVWCHMISDAPSGDDTELIQFAVSIGLKTLWIQAAGTAEAHFDVVTSKKALAIKKGAITIRTNQLGRMTVQKLKGEEVKF
jgi:hypothetical protein